MDINMIKVMIVDDLARVRLSLRSVLELMVELRIVGEAANGFEAVQMAKELKPDIVLMDLEMPGMDGFEATRQIKGRHQTIGVVALSIHSDRDVRQQAERAGVDAFIEKGVGFDTLFSTIRQVYAALSA
jgi:DNA-binding NarL/FixJ family response regulator